MIRYELDEASNTANAYFMTIHVVIPSSGHGKSQSSERDLNHVDELCNLLQYKHDVRYISVALKIMVVMMKCYLLPTQRHLVTFLPPTEIIFRVGLWEFRIIQNSFNIFTLIPNNSMNESLRVFELLFSHALSQLRKEIFNLKKYLWQYPMYPWLRCSF